jgi:hypothetical protein
VILAPWDASLSRRSTATRGGSLFHPSRPPSRTRLIASMLLIRIGAGIAGLTAALALKDKGLESSTIYAPKSAGEDTGPRTCPASAPPCE